MLATNLTFEICLTEPIWGSGSFRGTGWQPLVCKIKSAGLTLAPRPCLVCSHPHGPPRLRHAAPSLASPCPLWSSSGSLAPDSWTHVPRVACRASCRGSSVSLSPSLHSSPVASSSQLPGLSLILRFLAVLCPPTWAVWHPADSHAFVSLPSLALHSGCQGPWEKQVIDHVTLCL